MKSCTDLPQSKKLAEILPIESADLWYAERYAGQVLANGKYVVEDTPNYYLSLTRPSESNYSQDVIKDVPCWSLAALLELIPKNYLIEANKKTTRTLYHITAISGEVTHYHQDLVDAAVELLLKLYNKNIHEHRTD